MTFKFKIHDIKTNVFLTTNHFNPSQSSLFFVYFKTMVTVVILTKDKVSGVNFPISIRKNAGTFTWGYTQNYKEQLRAESKLKFKIILYSFVCTTI